MTLAAIALWIVKNRRGKAFEGYTFEKICLMLSECASKNLMAVVVDDSGISGVVCCSSGNKNELFVNDILTTKPGVVKKMMKVFHNLYPGHTITGTHRTGRKRKFTNTKKLANRL